MDVQKILQVLRKYKMRVLLDIASLQSHNRLKPTAESCGAEEDACEELRDLLAVEEALKADTLEQSASITSNATPKNSGEEK